MISASDTTHGCSDDKMYVEGDSNCFGSTKWEQARAGKHMLGIGFILFICEMIVSCGIVGLVLDSCSSFSCLCVPKSESESQGTTIGVNGSNVYSLFG